MRIFFLRSILSIGQASCRSGNQDGHRSRIKSPPFGVRYIFIPGTWNRSKSVDTKYFKTLPHPFELAETFWLVAHFVSILDPLNIFSLSLENDRRQFPECQKSRPQTHHCHIRFRSLGAGGKEIVWILKISGSSSKENKIGHLTATSCC